jgi:hypothetical protein
LNMTLAAESRHVVGTGDPKVGVNPVQAGRLLFEAEPVS